MIHRRHSDGTINCNVCICLNSDVIIRKKSLSIFDSSVQVSYSRALLQGSSDVRTLFEQSKKLQPFVAPHKDSRARIIGQHCCFYCRAIWVQRPADQSGVCLQMGGTWASCTCAVTRPLTPVFTRQHSRQIAHRSGSSWPFALCKMTSPHICISALSKTAFNCASIIRIKSGPIMDYSGGMKVGECDQLRLNLHVIWMGFEVLGSFIGKQV